MLSIPAALWFLSSPIVLMISSDVGGSVLILNGLRGDGVFVGLSVELVLLLLFARSLLKNSRHLESCSLVEVGKFPLSSWVGCSTAKVLFANFW